MAFATSNIVRESGGSTNIMFGTWTKSAGDADGTVTGNGYCVEAEFRTNLSTTPGQFVPTRISNSSGTWTVTVPEPRAVTAGEFRIEFK